MPCWTYKIGLFTKQMFLWIDMAGIYIHIPFCRQACHYCNFHFSTSLKYEDDLVNAICTEIINRKSYVETDKIKTIYFGGGTPSLIKDENLALIIDTLEKHFDLSEVLECTLEANPEDITKDKVTFWKSIGVDRLSIGIQSFHAVDLEWMNRVHSVDQAQNALRIANECGISFSADLIFGSATTTDEMWMDNLNRMKAYNPDHLSCYSLTVESQTALHTLIKKGKLKSPQDETIARQFYLTRDFLISNGYDHYEISNYSLPNKNALHNTNYWKSESYLGIGPSAHSYNQGTRSWNIANNAKYINLIKEGKSVYESETLSKSDVYNEYVMTRLRTKFGCTLEEIDDNFKDYFLSMIQKQIDLNHIYLKDNSYRLTEKAMVISDHVSSELFYSES